MPPEPVRLNLGAGGTVIAGFTAVGVHDDGRKVWPLDYPDNSVDEIRASHVLEHVTYRHTLDVLADWFRVLKPGGVMRVAVPDFEEIVKRYQAGSEEPVEGYLMGGHADKHDVHLALFTQDKLRECMQHVGLVDVRRWKSEIKDCAALDVSLNLMGAKPMATQGGSKNRPFRVRAVMTAPRYGFMRNFTSIQTALIPLGIPLRVTQGVFWCQGLTRGILETLEADPEVDAILTLDYDSVFTVDDVRTLVCLMIAHPEADALVPVQSGRSRATCLFTRHDENDQPVNKISRADLTADLMPISTGHFGLTLLRATALRALPQPWFHGRPGPTGLWDDDRVDDDVSFWVAWRKAGRSAFLANRVAIGHIEEMIAWPDQNIETIHQRADEWLKTGKPKEVWQ